MIYLSAYKGGVSVKKSYVVLVFAFLMLMAASPVILEQLEAKGTIQNAAAGIDVPHPTVTGGIVGVFERFKWSVKNTYTNYMPNYAQNVAAYNRFLRVVNRPLAFLKTSETPVYTPPADVQPMPQGKQIKSVKTETLRSDNFHAHYLLTVTDTNGEEYTFIDTALIMTEEQKSAAIESQAQQINRLYRSNADVNFYLYVAQRMQDTNYYESLVPTEVSTKPHYDKFFALLDDGITYDTFTLPTVFDRYEKVWKSDHHWNSVGAHEGYCAIINMMRQSTPSILPPREVSQTLPLSTSRFYGSFSRSCAMVDVWDAFSVNDYALPKHQVSPVYDLSALVKAFEKNPSTSLKTNLYAECFPKLHTFRFPENNTGRNLLVIGDSYAQGVAEPLASNFDNTYVYYFTTYKHMDYEALIREKNITDVIILQFSERVVFDALGDCDFDTIKTR